jgi:hypothetical protein
MPSPLVVEPPPDDDAAHPWVPQSSPRRSSERLFRSNSPTPGVRNRAKTSNKPSAHASAELENLFRSSSDAEKKF